jgi:hypothetical protein
MDNAMRVTRGNPVGFCGYKDDPANCGYKPYDDHPSAKAGLPNEVDLGQFVPAPWNQGLTASGTAHAFAGAITVALATHSRALPSPAWPRGLYFATRRMIAEEAAAAAPSTGKNSKAAPLLFPDVGTSAWWTIRLVRSLGIPTCRAETLEVDVRGPEYAAYLAGKINEPISDLGLIQSPLDFHAITTADPKLKIAQLVTALATGYPILGGIDSSCPAFQGYNDTAKVLDDFGPKADQMIYIAATRSNGKKGREFKIVNSWGWREWTHDSSAWISEKVAASGITNLLVPRVL